MTVPDTMPKRMTKASAEARVFVRAQNVRMSIEERAVEMRWTFKAPKLKGAMISTGPMFSDNGVGAARTDRKSMPPRLSRWCYRHS